MTLAAMGLERCLACNLVGSCGANCLRPDCIRKRAQPTYVVQPPVNPAPLSLDAVCLAPWSTLVTIPPALLDIWTSVFLDELRAFASGPSETTLLRVFLCSKVLLAQPFHGGKTKATAVERIVQRRIARWQAGQIQGLWEDMTVAWMRRRQGSRGAATLATSKEKEFRKVIALVNQGMPGKACRLLCSRGVAEGPDVLERMRQLFPSVCESVPMQPQHSVDIDDKAVQKILKAMPRGLAPGPSGLRTDHLLQTFDRSNKKKGGLFVELAAVMTQLAQQAIAGSMPLELARWLCGGRGIPLKKKDGGIRPLVVGEVVRAVISKVVLVRTEELAREALPAVQLGYSPGKNGIQAAIRTARFWALQGPDKVILKVDISNAYNCISRRACCDGAENVDPELGTWAQWCLATPNFVSCNGQVLTCCTGVQQGEPLSPLLFCIGLAPIVELLAAKFPRLAQLWYLDDGLIWDDPREVADCLSLLEQSLRQLGLSLNLRKCEIYAPEGLQIPAVLHKVPLVTNRAEWSYLGAPLLATKSHAVQAAATRAANVTDAIEEFGKTAPLQALELLRLTSGACRVIHLCQAAPPEELLSDLLVPTRDLLRRALCGILGSPIGDVQWAQACLPCRYGGLGLGDPTVVSHASRLAALVNTTETAVTLGLPLSHALHENAQALKTYNEYWGLRASCPAPEKDLQKTLTEPIQDLRKATLIATASAADMVRIDSVCTPHATDWLRGAGLWFSLTPSEARHAIRWILGVPLQNGPYSCPACGVAADEKGIHAVACAATGAGARGHTIVKCVLAEVYRATGSRVEMEQGPDDRPERPADILVTGLLPRPLAIDVTEWSRPSDGADPLDGAVNRKVANQKAMCQQQGWSFRVWAADVYGAMHPTARRMVTRLAGLIESRYATAVPGQGRQRVWRSISAAVVARAASQLVRHAVALENRVSSSKPDAVMGIPKT